MAFDVSWHHTISQILFGHTTLIGCMNPRYLRLKTYEWKNDIMILVRLSLSLVSLCGGHIFSNCYIIFEPSLLRDMLTYPGSFPNIKFHWSFKGAGKIIWVIENIEVYACVYRLPLVILLAVSLGILVHVYGWFGISTVCALCEYCQWFIGCIGIASSLDVLSLVSISTDRNIISYIGFLYLKFLPLWTISLIVWNWCSLFSEVV
jgi:hypothetical protein